MIPCGGPCGVEGCGSKNTSPLGGAVPTSCSAAVGVPLPSKLGGRLMLAQAIAPLALVVSGQRDLDGSNCKNFRGINQPDIQVSRSAR